MYEGEEHPNVNSDDHSDGESTDHETSDSDQSDEDQSDSDQSEEESDDVICMRLGNLLVIQGTDVVIDSKDPAILGIAEYDYQMGSWNLVVPQYPTSEMKRCAEEYNYTLPRQGDREILKELDQLEDTIEATMRNLIEAVRDLKRMIKP